MTTYYEKRGRRYIPVLQYDDGLVSSLPAGSHLIHVKPGSRSTTFGVAPDHAPLKAALAMHRDAMADTLRKASEARPSKRPLTAREQQALAAWYAVAGADSLMTLEIPSAYDVLDALERALIAACAAPAQ